MNQTDSISTRTNDLSAWATDSLGGGDAATHHGFSVWRIVQNMQGCTPQQIDSVIQANLPQREKFRSERPDTLSIPGLPGRKPYEAEGQLISFDQSYFSQSKMFHPELPYKSQGISATPLPYMLYRDNIVTGGLLLCLIILVYVHNKTRQQLKQQTKDFFFAPREHTGLFAVETSIESSARLFSILELCLMGGISMFAYVQYKLDFFLGQLSPRWLLSVYIGSFILYFLVKRILNGFVNWVFFPKSQQKLWRDSYFYLISVESFLFFPLALVFVYFRLPFIKTAWIFLFLLFTVKTLLAFKTYRIFFQKMHGLFHLFAYLCALELMPLLALWKTLAVLTENLIVKY